jgi:hypothetical protein
LTPSTISVIQGSVAAAGAAVSIIGDRVSVSQAHRMVSSVLPVEALASHVR